MQSLPFVLTADTENEIMEREAKALAKELEEDLERAFPDFLLPTMVEPSAERRLAHYVSRTAQEDWPLLQDPDYIDKYHAGLLPALISPLWANLVAIPFIWKKARADFLSLYRDRVEKAFANDRV